MFDWLLNTPLLAATKSYCKVKNLRKKFLELFLFIDSLFTKTATSFLIPDFKNNIFVETVTS